MPRTLILGVGIDDIDREGLERRIAEGVDAGRKEVIAYANVHAINIAQHNREFKEFLRSASIVYCDGEGVRLGARLLGLPPPPRTVLTRWVWDLGALFQTRGYSVFLLGGGKETVAAAARRLRTRYRYLKLVGYHGGYFDRTGRENDAVIDSINKARPNVLFVGFGMPVQELWVRQNFNRLKVNAIMPCGGMIDYLSGEAVIPPSWMSEHGLEWLHRLVQNPGRMWRRYVWGNPVFLFRVFLQRLQGGRWS